MPVQRDRERRRAPRTPLVGGLAMLAWLCSAPALPRASAGDEPARGAQARALLAADPAGREAALADAERSYDPALFEALLDEGGRLRRANDLHAALLAFDFARDLAQRAARPVDQGRARVAAAQILAAFGRSNEARAALLDARRLYSSAGAAEPEARALVNLGIIARMDGDLDAAAELYAEALARAEALGADHLSAIALNNLAVVHLSRGDMRSAHDALERGLRLERDSSSQLYADLLANFGALHQQQGEHELSIDYLRRSLQLQDALGNTFGSLNERNNLGATYLALERHAEARAVLEQSARLAEQGDAKELAARARSTLLRVRAAEGHAEAARDEARRAVALARESNTPDALSAALAESARLAAAQGRGDDALRDAREAVALAEALDSPRRVGFASLAQGEALLALGREDEAAAAFERAVAGVETQREQVAGGEIERQRFFELRLAPYEHLIELHVRRGRPETALAVAEQAKARVLIDVLHDGRRPLESLLGPGDRATESALRAALTRASAEAQAARRERQPDLERVAALEARRDEARRAREAFRAAALAAQPAARARRGDLAPVVLDDLRAQVDPGALVAEYVVTDRRTFLFTVDRRRGVSAHVLDIPRRDLARRTRAFRTRLAERDLDLASEAAALCRLLLGPARSDLAGRTRLIVIPDGPLWELPFQALACAPGRYLLEERALAYAPSLRALREMAHRAAGRRPGGSLLALGNPALPPVSPTAAGGSLRGLRLSPLPDAEHEVRALARLYGEASTVYVGREADEARVKAEAARHDVLHFAAHGLLDDARPLYSQLVLAHPGAGAREDGRLEAWEIMELNLRADLAVLSACETGRGRVRRGEGLIGLSWAFFVAGCPTTVVSQWKVDARSTSRLMVAFHRGLAAGRSKADALRDAALAVKRDPRFRHPFYWAAFIVVGADAPPERP